MFFCMVRFHDCHDEGHLRPYHISRKAERRSHMFFKDFEGSDMRFPPDMLQHVLELPVRYHRLREQAAGNWMGREMVSNPAQEATEEA